MKIIELTKNEVDLEQYLKRVASESDCSKKIDYDCIIKVDGVPKLAYFKIDNELSKFVRQSCVNIKLNKVQRLSKGLVTKGHNAVFGFRPARKMAMYADHCGVTGMARTSPLEHAALCDFAKKAAKYYKSIFPTQYEANQKIASEKINTEWMLHETVFTSGIVNKNSVLQYHYDIGHVSKALSVMLTLKKDLKGGGLSIPEIDSYIDLQDNTLLIFDGQELLHGVTPIVKQSKKSYRYTVVYYSLIQMWKCLTITEEMLAKRKKRFKSEERRAKGEVGEIATDLTKDGKRFNVNTHKKLSQK
jgi:hypothetical protein